MQKFDKLEGVAAPLPMINVDTDKVIPARFLKPFFAPVSASICSTTCASTRTGRRSPDFVLNKPAYRKAKFLSPATISAAARRASTRPGRWRISASAA